MAQAVTHVILILVIFSLYRDYFVKKKFSHFYVLFAGIAALLPDLDYPLDLLTGGLIEHGTFHIIYVPIFFALLTLLAYRLNWHRRFQLSFGIIAFAYFFHLLTDCAGGGYGFFLPFTSANYCMPLFGAALWPAFDAMILLFWLGHEYYAHKIKDFF